MKYLITGGCGFIGSNAASRCLRAGDRVAIVDNLSRPTVLRQACIYGYRQLVRDVFFIDDLVDAYEAVLFATPCRPSS